MSAVAVFVGGVGEAAVKEEGRCATEKIGVHGGGVTIIEAAIGDGDFDT